MACNQLPRIIELLVTLAAQVNQELCARFAVKYYPTLLWAAPPILASGDRILKGEGLEEVTNAYSAEKLLDWINKQLAKYTEAI